MSLYDVGTVKDTTAITIYHPKTREPLPNGDGTMMTVTVHGPYSARYKAVLREQQQRRATDIANLGTTLSMDELETMSREITIRCIETWSITLQGDDRPKFTPEVAEEVFAKFPWFRDQVSAAMGDVGNFLEPQKPH